MAIVYGQIESLSRLKETLLKKGIYDFSSIQEIEVFQDKYPHTLNTLQQEMEREYCQEYIKLQSQLQKVETSMANLSSSLKEKVESKLLAKRKRLAVFESKYIKNDFLEFFHWCYTLLLRFNIYLMEKSFSSLKALSLAHLKWQFLKGRKKFNYFEKNREKIIRNRLKPKLKRLQFTKAILDDLGPLIEGAKGENLVQKEIKKLSDEYILFNDFSVKFDPPIYNKKDKDRIFSIQIDHVLLCRAGVFAIETKNWSETTIANVNAYSPVQQVQRTGYALFTMLNSKKNSILKLIHHWGKRTIPVRNLVVMIKNKPHEKFDYVTVKNLKELNKYLTFLPPIFDASELESIAKRIKKLGNYK